MLLAIPPSVDDPPSVNRPELLMGRRNLRRDIGAITLPRSSLIINHGSGLQVSSNPMKLKAPFGYSAMTRGTVPALKS